MSVKPGQRARLRQYFLEHPHQPIDSETLRNVAGPEHTTNWSRRLRELRDEGMIILSARDRTDLRPNEYLFAGWSEGASETVRPIPQKTRSLVLDRDGYTCQFCGASAGETHPFSGRKTVLQIGHIIDRSMGGSDDPSNLYAVCSVCNEGASNITAERPEFPKLKAQVKRAPITVQLQLLKWMVEKFPREAVSLAQGAELVNLPPDDPPVASC
jgi:5-methylcytosine-specific restriction endonuclease McrA